MARLDRLATAREAAQLGATFWEVSVEVLEKFDKAEVEKGLRELQAALAEYILEQERMLEGE